MARTRSSASGSRNMASSYSKGQGVSTKAQSTRLQSHMDGFPSGPPLLEALNVGAIDFGNAGETPPIFAQAAGAPSATSPMIRLPPKGSDPGSQGQHAQIRRRSQRQKGCAQQRFKRSLSGGKGAKKGWAEIHRYQPVFLAPADAWPRSARPVDAWAIWDPYEAAAEASTGARTLTDGTDLVPTINSISSKRFLA